MEKEIVQDIKELIEYLLNIRTQELIASEETAILVNTHSGEYIYNEVEEAKIINNRFDKRLITLNSLLEKEEQNKDVLNIEMIMKEMNKKIDKLNEEKSSDVIKRLNEQEFINIEEFEILFKRKKDSQKIYRARNKNPLPTISSGGSGVDTIYDRLEAKKWVKRYL